MLLPLILTQLILAVSAKTFHKYPYVFLLDVGNEEIEKVNTEQLRLSIPGGSLAFKYPADGDGDLIGHVRVSGIDFGTDLKASIVQGGPGYKFVVLLFRGNPGVAYDAVVTIQTVPDFESEKTVNTNNNEEDELNNSAEETDDVNENIHSENIQSMQSSSSVYKYSNQEFDSQSQDEDDNDDGKIDSYNDQSILEEQDNRIENEDQDVDLRANSIDSGDNRVNMNQYGKYESFKPLIIGGVRFYPQAALYSQDYNNEKSIYDQEKHASDDGVSESK